MPKSLARWLLLAILLLTVSCGSDSGAADDAGQSDVADGLVADAVGGDALADSTGQPDLGIGDVQPDAGPGSPSIGSGAFLLVADPVAGELRLERSGSPLFRLPLAGIELGIVDALDDGLSYDPYPMVVEDPMFQPPRGFRWVSPVAMTVTAGADGASLTLTLSFEDDGTGILTVSAADEGRFEARLLPGQDFAPVAYMRLGARVDSGEGFYGLGEYFDEPNHRGHVRAMQLELEAQMESGYNEAHVPVPFVVGTSGWGLFVESFRPAAFDMATTADDLVEVTFGTGEASVEGLPFHLFGAEHPLDLTRHYYEVTGYPRLPAPWALGPWIWRDENRDQAQVEDDLDTIRELDLATTAYWIDRPYATAVNTFDFKESQFPDADAMIARMHALGFRTALWHTPYLDEGDEGAADLVSEAEANGYYPPEVGVLFNSWGRPVDLTNADAYDWWQGLIERYTSRGVEGFKLDYGEDIVAGLAGARVTPWSFSDGSDERTMHARYQLFYHRVYAELLPEDGGFLLCRGGTFGDQVNVNVIWPGDLDADMALHREPREIDGNERLSVGGLPAAVVAGTSLGPSGFPFFGSDTGGYRHAPPDKETFTRWFQHTALSPVMQIGTSSNDVAWEGNAENGFDAEMLDWYRRYTRLHLRLFPYLWTYARALASDGRPIQRALGLAYPGLGVHPPFTYLLGDNLLVAPVVVHGARERTLHLPPGGWIDWWTGERYEGPGELTVAAPLETLPLFLREGGIVPLLRPTIDTISPTDEPERVDSFDTDAGRLYARIAAGPESSFFLYDGTRISQDDDGTSVAVDLTGGSVFFHGYELELWPFADGPSDVRIGGLELEEAASEEDLEGLEAGWYHDATGSGRLLVRLGPGTHQLVVTR